MHQLPQHQGTNQGTILIVDDDSIRVAAMSEQLHALDIKNNVFCDSASLALKIISDRKIAALFYNVKVTDIPVIELIPALINLGFSGQLILLGTPCTNILSVSRDATDIARLNCVHIFNDILTQEQLRNLLSVKV